MGLTTGKDSDGSVTFWVTKEQHLARNSLAYPGNMSSTWRVHKWYYYIHIIKKKSPETISITKNQWDNYISSHNNRYSQQPRKVPIGWIRWAPAVFSDSLCSARSRMNITSAYVTAENHATCTSKMLCGGNHVVSSSPLVRGTTFHGYDLPIRSKTEQSSHNAH